MGRCSFVFWVFEMQCTACAFPSVKPPGASGNEKGRQTSEAAHGCHWLFLHKLMKGNYWYFNAASLVWFKWKSSNSNCWLIIHELPMPRGQPPIEKWKLVSAGEWWIAACSQFLNNILNVLDYWLCKMPINWCCPLGLALHDPISETNLNFLLAPKVGHFQCIACTTTNIFWVQIWWF